MRFPDHHDDRFGRRVGNSLGQTRDAPWRSRADRRVEPRPAAKESFLRLDRLLQAFAPGSLRHGPAGELIDDHHFVNGDDVLFVAMKELTGGQRLLD